MGRDRRKGREGRQERRVGGTHPKPNPGCATAAYML